MSWRAQKIASVAGRPDYGYTTQVGNGAVLSAPQRGHFEDYRAGADYVPEPNLPRDPQELYYPHGRGAEEDFGVFSLAEQRVLYGPIFQKDSYRGVKRIGSARRSVQPPPHGTFGSHQFCQPQPMSYFPDHGLPRLRSVPQPEQRWHL